MRDPKRASVVRFPEKLSQSKRGGVATLGNFDCVHLGHARVVAKMLEVGHGRHSSVVSFYPHPLNILRKPGTVRCLSSNGEKASLLGALGVDTVYFIHFTKRLAALSADEFIDQVFVEALGITDLVVGGDVAIGRDREGNLEFLLNTLPRVGINLHTVSHLDVGGNKAGSRRIRELVAAGAIEDVIAELGRPFEISGKVCHGDKRGATLGYPTANLSVGNRLLPRRGVYVCRVKVRGATYDAVANIGVRPTFRGAEERVEVHILDLPEQSLYGVRMHLEFIARLRDEMSFQNIESLVNQIGEDIREARMRLRNV